MATPSSGQLRFSDIENEFGQSANQKIGDYIRTWEYGDLDLPLDDGIPTVQENVRFSDFRNKKMNLVVDFFTVDGETRQDALVRYTGVVPGTTLNGSDIVGPGGTRYGTSSKSNPSNGGGKKVIIHVNKKIGSEKTNDHSANGGANPAGTIGKCALKTGSTWAAGTQLFVKVGDGGLIVGAGGDGGAASSEAEGSGSPGYNGTAGLGVEWENTEITVTGNGKISTGFPGGGGGGGAKVEREEIGPGPKRRAYGGGGGGGAGYPSGTGGNSPRAESGFDGSDSDITLGGEGGEGTSEGNNPRAVGGAGGDGGASGSAAQGGIGGQCTGSEQEDEEEGAGGAAGEAMGGAIRKTEASISWSFGTGHITNNVVGDGNAGDGESQTGIS